MVREIAQLCMASGTTQHVDPSIPRPGFGRARQAQTRGPARPAVRWGHGPMPGRSHPERGVS